MSHCRSEINNAGNAKTWMLPAHGNKWDNGSVLESSVERVALLKAGFSGKDIESIYLQLNGIKIIGVNWKD